MSGLGKEIRKHREITDEHEHFGCLCGEYGPHQLAPGFDWYAEHIADVARGYRRTVQVSWAGPSSDSRVRKAATK